MLPELNIKLNSLTLEELTKHFKLADLNLSRITIESHASKVFQHAQLIEAWYNNILIGLIAVYMNDDINKTAYITHVYVYPAYRSKGIANKLLQKCIELVQKKNYIAIGLEVDKNNLSALRLYKRHNFSISEEKESNYLMHLKIIY